MKQIRLYYESLEQGYDYIRPIIESAIKDDTEIVYVRRPKKYSELNPGAVSAILSMTTPDALITGVSDDKEYPLVLIEFTEAVTTEDHELQRTYGAIAAYLSNAYYLKLSGEKQSEKVFGGAKYNPYSTPKIFLEHVGYEGYIIANWDTEDGNEYTLVRDSSIPSCPPRIRIFEDTIVQAISAFLDNPSSWYKNSLVNLKTKESYQNYRDLVEIATGKKELTDSWRHRRDTNLNKLRYYVREDFVAAKINRFGHAMDPDRGILTFMSFLFSETTKVYGIYALVRPRGERIMKIDLDSVATMNAKLEAALEHDNNGVPSWFADELLRMAKSAKSLDEVIDIQDIWEKNKNRILDSKVVMTIAYFLDGLKLNHNGITFVWDKRKLLETKESNIMPAFSKKFQFGVISSPTPLKKVINVVDEDEVTYTIIHKVLIPNGFKIISVSYPGAQGGNAILPDPTEGKAQKRIYIDTVALPPANSGLDVLLNESKGMFAEKEVNDDVNKLSIFKTSRKHIDALQDSLVVAKVIDKDKKISNIVIGVSFGTNDDTYTIWNPSTVDFIFRIVNRNKWAIGIFKQELKDAIRVIEGTTDFPLIHICNK